MLRNSIVFSNYLGIRGIVPKTQAFWGVGVKCIVAFLHNLFSGSNLSIILATYKGGELTFH